jgi:hypothetical protein
VEDVLVRLLARRSVFLEEGKAGEGRLKRTLKKYKSRPSCVLGALLSFMLIWPVMTMTMHIRDASVRSIGVRIHAKRPTLPMIAVGVWSFNPADKQVESSRESSSEVRKRQ